MSEQTPRRQMFPESRLMLGMLSPVLGVFFAFCIYFTGVWQPSTIADRIGKFAVEDILFTFIALCGVGLLASVVGPHRIRPLILRVGGKAARAGVALILGTIVYILYCWLAS
jgi:predicted membrane protein